MAKKLQEKIHKSTKKTAKVAAVKHEKKPVKKLEEVKLPESIPSTLKYFEAVGRRKNAIARARLFLNVKEILVNQKPFDNYFKMPEFAQIVMAPLHKMKITDRMGVTFLIKGGGLRGQAEAARHALARALVKYNADYRKRLKKAGFLRRDPRMKERKKYGLKKARRAPQWQKR